MKVIQYNPVYCGGWELLISMCETTGVFCLTMVHVHTQRVKVRYFVEEEEAVNYITTTIERTNHV
jgi:hypothetical protein